MASKLEQGHSRAWHMSGKLEEFAESGDRRCASVELGTSASSASCKESRAPRVRPAWSFALRATELESC